MGKIDILKSELAESQARCASLQEKCDRHQTQMYVINARRIRAEKELARLREELQVLKGDILR